jgi:hypothetical protein
MQCRSTRASLLLFVIVALHGLVTVATAQEIPKELWGNWRITKKVSKLRTTTLRVSTLDVNQ